MNIPSIESLYATIEQQQRVIKQAHDDIAKLTAENINLIDAQAKSLQTIVKLTTERDRFANMISESSNRWQEMMFALREAKEVMSEARYSGTPYTSKYSRSLATINKVLGEE